MCVRVCWPLPVSVRGGKVESGETSGGRPAAWEVWELERNYKERDVIRQRLQSKNHLQQHQMTKLSPKKYSFYVDSPVKLNSLSYRSLQMQMIGRSRMDSFFFFFFAVSASPPGPSFLFRVANRMLIAACRTQQMKKYIYLLYLGPHIHQLVQLFPNFFCRAPLL